MYDEVPNQDRQFPPWMILASDSTFAYITRQRQSSYDLTATYTEDDVVQCKISESQGDNVTYSYPTKVQIQIKYYQVNSTFKRLIECDVSLSLYKPATTGMKYAMTYKLRPLSHTQILIAFGFNSNVYALAFLMIGVISSVQNIVLGIYHWIVSSKRRPVEFLIYLKLLKGMMIGTINAMVPIALLLLLVSIIMTGTVFNWFSINTIWTYLEESNDEPINSGRTGLVYLSVACYLMLRSIHNFVGCEREDKQRKKYSVSGTVVEPVTWESGKLLLITFLYILFSLFWIYFAYSNTFGNNIWLFIILGKIIQMLFEEFTDIWLEDCLMAMPLKITLELTSYLATLSANDFYDFMFSFLIDVAMNMCEKAYVASLQNYISDWIKDKIDEIKQYFEKVMDNYELGSSQIRNTHSSLEEEDEKDIFLSCRKIELQHATSIIFKRKPSKPISVRIKSEDIPEEAILQIERSCQDPLEHIYKKRLYHADNKNAEITEQILENESDDEQQEKTNLTIQFVADILNMPFTCFFQLFAIGVLWLTYTQSNVLANYGIPSKITPIYFLSAVIIGTFTIFNMFLIFFILENYHLLQIKEYLERIIVRFEERATYWKSDDNDINPDLQQKLRSVDHLCLSSQYFFVVSIYVLAMFLFITGIITIVQNSYSLFSDSWALFIVAFWLALLYLGQKLCFFFAEVFNMWDGRKFKETHSGFRRSATSPHLIYIDSKKNNPRMHMEEIEVVPNMLDQNEIRMTSSHSANSPIGSEYSRVMDDTSLMKLNRLQSSSHSLDKNQQGNSEDDQIIEDDFEECENDGRTEFIVKRKLESICKSLQHADYFNNQTFRLEYVLKNKEYFKNNVQEIIPLVEKLPELPPEYLKYEYCESKVTVSGTGQAHKQTPDQNNLNSKVSQQSNYSRESVSRQSNKIYSKEDEAQIKRFLNGWAEATDHLARERKADGLNIERSIQKCRFCFNSWGIYFGYGGICFKCNQEMLRLTKKEQ